MAFHVCLFFLLLCLAWLWQLAWLYQSPPDTALIERVNLTVRHGVAALARRTWATAKPAPQRLVHLEWWRASSHFVRPHASLRVALVQPRVRGGKLMAQRDLQRTPAMAAGSALFSLAHPSQPKPLIQKAQSSSVQPIGKYGIMLNRRVSAILEHQQEQTMSTTRARVGAIHVFISYSRANFQFVQRLVADLQRSGITVWVDQSGLTPGTPDWETALRDAIGKAHAVILIASEDARKSPYVKDELRLAHDVHHLPIYPLWVAGTQWINCIPLGWGGTQYIDARGGEAQYQAAFHQLIAALSGANPVTSLSPTSTFNHPPLYSNQFSQNEPTSLDTSYPIQSQPTHAGSGRRSATWLIATFVTLLLVGVLIFFTSISHLINSSPGQTGPDLPSPASSTGLPSSGSSTGQLTATPTNFNITRTEGTSNGCFYFSGNGWSCTVTLKNVSNSGTLTWTTDTSPSNVTVSPSTFLLPAQQSMEVTIKIPDNTCGQSDITFKGPQNIIHVTINCSG